MSFKKKILLTSAMVIHLVTERRNDFAEIINGDIYPVKPEDVNVEAVVEVLNKVANEGCEIVLVDDIKEVNSLPNLIGNISDKLVAAEAIHFTMTPTTSEQFISNKTKWNKPRWQR